MAGGFWTSPYNSSNAKSIRIKSILLSQGVFFAACLSAHAATFSGTSGPDTFVGSTANDIFFGFDGNDALFGDFFFDGPGFPDIEIPCKAGAGVEHQPVDGVTGATSLANDGFSDGSGDDTVIGDASARNFGEFQLNALAGTGAIFGGAGSDFSSALCFSDSGVLDLGEDSFAGGNGNDIFVGDADHGNIHPENVELDAGAGSAAMGRFSFYPHGPGGDGGNNNALQAFNDVVNFQWSFQGTKTLVGDVRGNAPAGSDDRLIASAGTGGRSGGNGGDMNTVSAFNDRLAGGTRENLIVGDDFRDGGSGAVLLVASAGAGGQDSLGGQGGSNNAVQAFSDVLRGMLRRDVIVGDALMDGSASDDLMFEIHAGFTQPGGGRGGVWNTVSAFNDDISGGLRDDTLIGEGWNKGSSEAIRVFVGGDSGNSGNSVRAFSDTIDGGQGADQIYGDFRFDGDVCDIDQFELVGALASQLFADRITAGLGFDIIHGGFGADTMTGGFGRDTYVYYEPDLTDLGGGMPVDLITDFFISGPSRDRFDMRPLLRCLGFDPGDAINDWLRVSGTDMEIDKDGPGAGFGFTKMITAPGLSGTTATGLVSSGNLLIP